MPELPEVETMRRGLGALVGRRVAAVEFPRGSVRPISIRPRPAAAVARLTGRTVAGVHRRGKRVVLEFAPRPPLPRHWLVVEPRMTGLFLLGAPPSADHVRMRLRLRGAARPRGVVFWDRRGLGTIRLVDDDGLEAICGRQRLGPDGLVLTGAELRDATGRSRRAVKVALLDQRVVAGIGNIYAAEILHRARIDPRTRCRRLPAGAWERIAAATRAVLAEAVRLEGSSIGDETYRTTDDRPGRAQRRHRVYGRARQPCRACGAAVVRIVQAQRSTFFCPVCQPRPGGASRRCLACRPAMP